MRTWTRKKCAVSRAKNAGRPEPPQRRGGGDQASARGGGLGGAGRSALSGADTAAVRPAHDGAGERKTRLAGAATRRILPGTLPATALALSASCCCFACWTARQRLHISPPKVFFTAW